jgi:copper chaperone CopZ
MRKVFVGVFIAADALSVAAFALAEKPKTPPLTAVTVAVDGLHCQACADELQKDLGKVPGVAEVTVTVKPGQAAAKLDESKITASEFIAAIGKHAQMMDRQKTYGAKLVAHIDTAMCAKQQKMCEGCFTEIPKVLKGVKGVSDVTLDETGKVATIGFANDAKVATGALTKALARSSYKFTVKYAGAAAPAARNTDQGSAGMNCDQMKSDGSCPMGSDNCCGMQWQRSNVSNNVFI